MLCFNKSQSNYSKNKRKRKEDNIKAINIFKHLSKKKRCF